MHKWLIVFTLFVDMLLAVFSVQAQHKKENVFLHPQKFYDKYFPHVRIKYKPSDSTYIKVYPKSYMTIGLRIFSPKIYYNLQPHRAEEASSYLRTSINTITGLSFSYRHITAGFALTLLPPLGDPPDLAPTYYRTATIKYKSPIYILTFKFMKVKGMTDVNAFHSIDPAHPNIHRPDITMREYQFEGIYNFSWKKYSYLSTIDYTESQIKSRMGFLLKAGIYTQQVDCDTNLLQVAQRKYFSEFNNVNKIVAYNLKLSPGIGASIVFKKHYYLSASIFSPLSLYVNRLYASDDKAVHKETSLQWLLDGAVSMGYQTQHFYVALRSEIDGRTAVLNTYTYVSAYTYFGLDIGYRFNAPDFIQKFYKETMPPGM